MLDPTKKYIPILTGKQNTSSIAKDLTSLYTQFNPQGAPESKDITMVKSMMQYARAEPQTNLADVKIEYDVTRKTHIAFVLLPKWAVHFPPYNIARLAAVTKAAGYKTTVLDYNVRTWHALKNILPDDPWEGHGSKDFLWCDSVYEEQMKQHAQPLLDQYINELVEMAPDVVGFSIYYTNVLPTFYVAEQLKKQLPNVKIIGGGSQIQWFDENNFGQYPNFDHVVKGEAEELILELLQKIENKEELTQYQYNSDFGRRINLDTLPFPDYSDLNVSQYMAPNAISSEISRGCVAKCVFCAETLFWKYRGRQAPRILDELEYQYKAYGSNTIWFIDSLVNGNINELRAFALGVVERNLPLKWQGYCRCDSRMDLAYLTDLRNGGCRELNFGIESGSQPVLDAMKKNTTIDTIEQNLRDASNLGIVCGTNWMLGFPSEGPNDFARTMTLVWRMQKHIGYMSRQAMNLGPSRIEQNKELYNIYSKNFLNNWTTPEFDNTKIHRLIRVKCFNILVECIPTQDFQHNKLLTTSYDFNVEPKTYDNNITDVVYEDFDYEVIKDPVLNTIFKRTVVNEVWTLFRTLWRGRGKTALEVSVRFDPDWDYNTHGSGLSGDQFSAAYKFDIDANGNWTASAKVKFDAPTNPYRPWWNPEPGEVLDFDFALDWCSAGKWA